MGPDISSPVRKDTVAAFSARIRERGEAERSEETGWGSKRESTGRFSRFNGYIYELCSPV